MSVRERLWDRIPILSKSPTGLESYPTTVASLFDIKSAQVGFVLLLLLVLGLLELLDPCLVVFDLGLLLVELVEVALVSGGRLGHLLQVRPQPALVLRNVAQQPLLLLQFPLGDR